MGVAALLLAAFALTFGAASATASDTLFEQLPGPSGVAVPSDEAAEWSKASDDFNLPVGPHWHLEAIQVFGKAAIEGPRTFNVKIGFGGGGTFPPENPEAQVFSERVTVAGGPDYVIPLAGAPPLDRQVNYEPGQYWVTVQALSTGGEDEWSWLTGPDTAGTAAAYQAGYLPRPAGAEPGLAFRLLGTATQVVKAAVAGAGTLVSSPAGISCPGTCVAEFPHGTALTFGEAPNPGIRFIEWGFRNTGFMGPSSALVPVVVPSPCGGAGGCAFTLEQDTNVGAVFEPIDEASVLRVLHNRHTGTGRLLLRVPGAGELTMIGERLAPYLPGAVSAGVVGIPLIPTKEVAKTLRQKGRATVVARIQFRAMGAAQPGTIWRRVTLFRKRPRVAGAKHR